MKRKTAIIILLITILLPPIQNVLAESFKIKKLDNGGYVLMVNDKPFLLNAVSYNPVPIGAGYDHDFFLNKTKPWLTDGKLMQEMGVNAVRIYTADSDVKAVKGFIRDMYEKFGIYTLVSDWLGLWDSPTVNYADIDNQKRIKEKVLKIVEALKDEEGILMWILGNENNYTFSGKPIFWTSDEIEALESHPAQVIRRAEIYYTFVNELAFEIKKIDKKHLIALGHGETSNLDIAAPITPNLDLIAVIMYRGKTFGTLFDTIRQHFNKPVILSEFGCDAYNVINEAEDQESQSKFLISQWKDIYRNSAFGAKGGRIPLCLGGVLFEWTDEWWKHAEADMSGWGIHNPEGSWYHASYYFDNKIKGKFNINEEWFGLMNISPKLVNGINKRTPRKAYYDLKEYFSNLSLTLPVPDG